MIALTYAISGLLIAGSGYLFMIGAVSALTQSLAWMVTFFFASAAASAAYLTAGEIFPLEIRALAIAFFFAVGTGIGGVVSPWLFATLIKEGPKSLYLGYILFSAAMIAARFASQKSPEGNQYQMILADAARDTLVKSVRSSPALIRACSSSAMKLPVGLARWKNTRTAGVARRRTGGFG